MKKRKKGCLIFLMVILVAAAIITWCQTPNRKLEIDSDTTFYAEPLLGDGRVDYLTILNRIHSDGVNNENNALIPLLDVLDLSASLPPESIDRFLRHLGLGKIESKHKLEDHQKLLDVLFPLDPADEEASQIRENEMLAANNPWKAANYPQLADVLQQQTPALDIIVEASRRPRYFAPIIDDATSDDERMLMAVLLPVSQEFRSFANSLSFRAMNRLGDGNVEGAIEDIKAIRRLARLIDQSPALIDGLVSVAIDRIAADAETHLIQLPEVTTDQLRDYQQFLVEAHPFRVSMLTRIGRTERCLALDTLSCMVIYGDSSLLSSMGLDSQVAPVFAFVARSADPNEALREVNRYFDETVSLLETTDIRERLANAQAWNESLMRKEVEFIRFGRLASSLISGPSARGRLLGELSIFLLAPAFAQLYVIDVRRELSDRLMHLAISIEMYERAVGRYPDTLADLQPDYISEIPQDWFSTGTVTYRRTDSGFVVYSIGENQVDDGGFDNDEGPVKGRDDIRVRVGKLEK